ncbi:hypothetical protein KO317_01210 [Candidatus Micrarchaeota archaeon]|jgi:hypothetical protein|nr:hypothetical protein [Candidatus Micrarchaeota archaeon]
MIVILAIDALEYDLVEKWDMKELKQLKYGKTNLSDYSEPRTMVLWSSILSGKNKEEEILKIGDKEMWNFKLKTEETFFSMFNKYLAIDVPGFTQDIKYHELEREQLKKFFNKEIDVDEFDKPLFEHHKQNKEQFLKALNGDYEIVMGYFGLIDVVGHISFGLETKMKILYKEMEEIAKIAEEKADILLILSDHGMEAIGRFGDHSDHGFWSLNINKELGFIKPVEIYKLIKEFKEK